VSIVYNNDISLGVDCQQQCRERMVIVGGMISDLAMSIFLLPTLYAWMARDNDVLPEIEGEFE
jgi:cobalt-zinc-cadmium resistance protein CzcA